MNRLKNVLRHILCIFCLSILAQTAFAQDAKVTIDIHDASLKSLLKTIEKQTPYHFSYNSADVSRVRNITLKLSQTPVSAVLGKVLDKTGLTYYMMSNEIIAISPKVKTAGKEENQNFKISGVVSHEDGEPVIGATV